MSEHEEWASGSEETGSESEDAAPPSKTQPSKPPIVPKPVKSKWEGEDQEEEVASDWEESSDDESKTPALATTAAPPKKKGTLKAKLAEKEAQKAARKAAGDDSDLTYDSDDVLDPREKARRDKEKELKSDLNNAAELFGAAALGGTSDKELDKLVSANPRTKSDFEDLSKRIIEYIIKRHHGKPLYPAFVEHHVRELALPLKDVEVRKAASGLTTLANEKQKEAKDKASGKKKVKASKPALGGVKITSRLDTSVYDEPLDDFGNGADDFM